jgi:hypothetical protein
LISARWIARNADGRPLSAVMKVNDEKASETGA